MEWLAILVLAGFGWLQWRRTDDLSRAVERLERVLADILQNGSPSRTPEPAGDGEDVLLLDTPVPAACNDTAPEPSAEAPAPLPPAGQTERPLAALAPAEPEPSGGQSPARIDPRRWGLLAALAAACALLAIEVLIPVELRATGTGAAALMFAAAWAWRGWRAFSYAALGAAALALGHQWAPLLAAGDGAATPNWGLFGNAAMTTGLLYGARLIAARRQPRMGLETALSCVAALGAIVCVFWLIRWGVGAGTLLEAGLRTLAMVGAGYGLLRLNSDDAAWPGHALTSLGLLHAFAAPGLAFNPWWGGADALALSGPPVFNVLALNFAAPAAVALAAAARIRPLTPNPALAYTAAGAALLLVWAVMEVRQAFHGGSMSSAPAGLFESACYALTLLVFAIALNWTTRRQGGTWLTETATGVGVAGAAFILLISHHPLWGSHDGAASNELSALLATLAQALSALLAFGLARLLSAPRSQHRTRFFAAAAAAILVWSFGHCALRWLHHRGFMDDGVPPLELEGLGHALWPLALVLVALHLMRGKARQGHLGDLRAIWSSAAWPALAYAGAGLWWVHNPWWGAEPARFYTPAGAFLTLAAFSVGAGMSYLASTERLVEKREWFAPPALVACLAHVLAGAAFMVRWLYHRNDMIAASVAPAEMWAYSGVSAILGAAVLGIGLLYKHPTLRWSGLVMLTATALKVFALDIAGLHLLARVVLVLAVLSAGVAFARRLQPKPNPRELITVKAGARRGSQAVRRRAPQASDTTAPPGP